MEEKDLNEVAILYESLMDKKSDIDDIIEKFSLMKKNDNYILIVAEENNKVVGTVMGVVCPTMLSNFNAFLVVESLIVDKNCRGKGVGKAMLLELETRAKSMNCSYLILVSGSHRKEAHKLYEAMGYAKDGAKGFRKYID